MVAVSFSTVMGSEWRLGFLPQRDIKKFQTWVVTEVKKTYQVTFLSYFLVADERKNYVEFHCGSDRESGTMVRSSSRIRRAGEKEGRRSALIYVFGLSIITNCLVLSETVCA